MPSPLFQSFWLSVAVLAAAMSSPGTACQVTPGTDEPTESRSSLKGLQDQVISWLPAVQPALVGLNGGTGVIVRSDGLVLTAAHVIPPPGSRFEAVLADGFRCRALSLYRDSASDLAMVQLIGRDPWPCVEVAGEKDRGLGDWVVALGYPFSFPRGTEAAVRIGCLIEVRGDRWGSDCPIMGGDSGGPLFDREGTLVAIHSRISRQRNGNFHVAIDRQTVAKMEAAVKDAFPEGSRPTLASLQPATPPTDLTSTLDPRRENASRLRALTEIVSSARLACVELQSSNGRIGLGTVVSPDGLVVTKASQLKLDPSSIDGKVVTARFDQVEAVARLVAIDAARDLAMLELDLAKFVGTELQAVVFPKPVPRADRNIQRVKPGQIVISVFGRRQSDDPSWGTIMIAPQAMPAVPPVSADLGMRIEFQQPTRPADKALVSNPRLSDSPAWGTSRERMTVAIQDIYENSLADKLGLQAGDRLESINGITVTGQATVLQLASQLKMGDPVSVVFVNSQGRLSKFVRINSDHRAAVFERWGGGPFSERSFDLGTVLAHDGDVHPQHCGGPLYDLNGTLVGFNLARPMRVATYAISARAVADWILLVRPDASLVRF